MSVAIKSLNLYVFDETNEHTTTETVTVSVVDDFQVPGRPYALEIHRLDGVDCINMNSLELRALKRAIDNALEDDDDG